MNGTSRVERLWLLITIIAACAAAGCGDESPPPTKDASADIHVAQSASKARPAPSPDASIASDSAGTSEDKDTVPRIVAFGDSLTAGYGVAPQDTYPAQLQRRLVRPLQVVDEDDEGHEPAAARQEFPDTREQVPLSQLRWQL